jgi:hypothetical protein
VNTQTELAQAIKLLEDIIDRDQPDKFSSTLATVRDIIDTRITLKVVPQLSLVRPAIAVGVDAAPDREAMCLLCDELKRIALELAGGVKKSVAVEDAPANKWKAQLQNLSEQLFGKDDLSVWVDAQYQKIHDALQPHPRLLKQEEKFGIVQLPMLIGRGYISSLAWRYLEREGYQIEWAMAQYTILRNPRLLGISNEMLQETLNSFASALVSLQGIDKSLKGLGVVGQIRRKGHHLYTPLMPAKLVADGEINVQDWAFLS